MDVGSTVYGGSDHMTALLQNNHRHLSSSSSSEPIDSLWLPSPSPSFRASDSMVNFDDVKGRRISSSPDVQTPTFRPRSREETGGGSGDDEFDPSFHHHPEKKRRLTVEQVQYLERSFEVENKLEPERKVQLAKELGLQPRQVAIWFQNRRARFKTKQLEKDYDLLKASYDTLKADYDILLKEKENLMTEVAFLTNKLKPKEKQMTNSDPHSPIDSNHLEPKELAVNAISENVDKPETAVVVCKQEDASSAKSDVFDSESPHCTEGNHSSLLEPANSSSHMFEPEQQSDFSQDEEDQYLMSRSLLQPLPPPPAYNFPKLEEGCYTAADPHGNSGSLILPVEDQHFWSWLYQS